MARFRCMFDEIFNPPPVCALGGQLCPASTMNTVEGVELGGTTKLRKVQYPDPTIPTLSPSATSEDAAGGASDWPTNTWKRLVASNQNTFAMAGCRTRGHIDGVPIHDIFGCVGVPQAGFNPVHPDEPGDRPNDVYATCGYTIEAGFPFYVDRHCIQKTTKYEDIPVTLRTDPEFQRTVFVHDGYCEALNNRQCYGLGWIAGNESFGTVASSWPAWRRIGVQLHNPHLRWWGNQVHPLADRRVIDLHNQALAFLPGPGWFNLGFMTTTSNNDFQNWSLNRIDVWRAGFDALAPGGAGCAALPVVRTFSGRTRAANCPVVVHWVPLRASYAMSMSLYGVFRERGVDVFPAIEFHIDIEMGFRMVMGPCPVNEPHLGGPVNVQPLQECTRSLHALTLNGDEVIIDMNGSPVTPPRYIRWRGHVGPDSGSQGRGQRPVDQEGGQWKDVANIPPVPGSGGFTLPPVCCPTLIGLEGFNIPAKIVNPTQGRELYGGSVSIYPNVDGEVTAYCGGGSG